MCLTLRPCRLWDDWAEAVELKVFQIDALL